MTLVFDLDDTLLDTYHLLVPIAAREACTAMIAAGLRAQPEACMAERTFFLQQNPRGDVYTHLVQYFGVHGPATADEVAKLGYTLFHKREIREDLQLVPGTLELLQELARRHTLFLVTAGDPLTQRRKVELLKIETLFRNVFYVDVLRGESKETAFRHIQNIQGEPTARSYLSIGNRIDTDIAPAKKLGWQTCWVQTGEHVRILPVKVDEQPDYTIQNIRDFATQCPV